MSKTVALISPPGAGKSTMIAKTANQPVHFLDIDRKILSMDSLSNFVSSGRVSVWELEETLAEESLASRVREAAEGKKPSRKPMGWEKFAGMVDRLKTDETAQAAQTWAIDSYTRVGDHLKRLILWYDDKAIASLSQKNWGAYLAMQEETITSLIDIAKQFKKDLILTIHERVSDIPTANTRVRYSKNKGGDVVREFQGDMDIKISPSVEGSFALKMFSYFEEVYALRVEVTNGIPLWVCRVKPDGLRDLRTSFNVKKDEFEPDFQKIWR